MSSEKDPIFPKDAREGVDLEAHFDDEVFEPRNLVELGPNGKEKFLLFLGGLGSLMLGGVPLAFYYFFGALLSDLNETIFEAYLNDGGSLGVDEIDAIISEQVEKTSYYIFMMAGVAGIAAMLQLIPLIHVGESIASRLRLSLYSSILFQEIGWFDQTDTGTLASHLSEDCLKVKDAYGEKLGQSLQALAQSVGGLGFAMYKSWSMSLVMLGMAPIIALPVVFQAVKLREITENVSKASAEAMSTANETVSGIRTLRAFSMEYAAIKRFNDALESLNNVASKRAWLQGISMGFIQIAIWSACAVAFLYGGFLIKRDSDFNIGDLITVFGMMLFACVGLSQAVAILPEFAKSSAAFEILRVIIEREPRIPPSGGLPVPAGKGVLEFQNVSFSYPSRPDLSVMSDLSFTALPGTVVAFVGESGSGKTTIFNLIERFYDPTSGQILLDGQDIKTFDPPSLRSIMSIVSQEPVLFAASIKENILFAKPDASDSDVVEAAKVANAHNFIVDLPDGYNTWVGERGVQLSGGQKQRIAIARAVLRNPRILLLDEATSALDTESERLVQEALENIMIGRTSFVIAHRLATVVHSDQILVMSKGKLVGAGNHESLLAENDIYRQLATRQLSMK